MANKRQRGTPLPSSTKFPGQQCSPGVRCKAHRERSPSWERGDRARARMGRLPRTADREQPKGSAARPTCTSTSACRISKDMTLYGTYTAQQQQIAPQQQWQPNMGGYYSMQQAIQQPPGQYSHLPSDGASPQPGIREPGIQLQQLSGIRTLAALRVYTAGAVKR